MHLMMPVVIEIARIVERREVAGEATVAAVDTAGEEEAVVVDMAEVVVMEEVEDMVEVAPTTVKSVIVVTKLDTMLATAIMNMLNLSGATIVEGEETIIAIAAVKPDIWLVIVRELRTFATTAISLDMYLAIALRRGSVIVARRLVTPLMTARMKASLDIAMEKKKPASTAGRLDICDPLAILSSATGARKKGTWLAIARTKKRMKSVATNATNLATFKPIVWRMSRRRRRKSSSKRLTRPNQSAYSQNTMLCTTSNVLLKPLQNPCIFVMALEAGYRVRAYVVLRWVHW